MCSGELHFDSYVLDIIDLVGQNHDFVTSDVIEEHSHSLRSPARRTHPTLCFDTY